MPSLGALDAATHNAKSASKLLYFYPDPIRFGFYLL